MNNTSVSKYDARFCPKCGCKTRVINCERRGAYFMRYRKCKGCNFVFKTKEVILKREEDVEVE